MIKFLKKFKEKILIALACSFIGIGTLLSNTLETKAYVSDEFSYTLTFNQVSQDGSYIYDLIEPISASSSMPLNLNSICIIVQIDVSSYNNNSSIGSGSVSFNNSNYTGLSCYRYNNVLSRTCLVVGSYNFYLYSNLTQIGIYFPSISSDKILKIDVVKLDELSLLPYIDDYVGQLQSDYDTLQDEYTIYQNTHAYTNEQYNSLMSQNASLTQQVQSLQSQYDTYVSLHSYTNTQYETLLNNYNNLQTMYNSLQQQYLDLQQRYNELNLLLSPFIDNVWNRSATLNGATIDISSTSYHNNVVSFNGTYLEIFPYDMDIYSSYIQGKNDFQMIASSSSTITIGNYTAIAPLSHSLEDGFRIEFYLDSNIVYSTTWFDNDMTASDGSSSTDTFNSIVPITFNRFILYLEASTATSGFTSYSYFKATTGSFNDGYNYAVEQLTPRINDLENGLQQAISQQQVKYNEGYNQGISDANSQPLYGMVIRIL